MIIQGTLKRPRLTTAARALLVASAAIALLCGVSFVAGASAYRQGHLHGMREVLLGWMQPMTRLESIWRAPEAPVIALHLKFSDLQKLRDRREEALDVGTLLSTPDDEVSAVLAVGDQRHAGKIRLKGDAVDHLRGQRWSFRVVLDSDERLWGMRRFSLQHPGTRGFEREWLFHRHLASEGLLALRYRFARLHVNGDDVGLVAVEEHFSKELLESQQRREAPILKFDETAMWRRYALRRGRDLLDGEYDIAPIDTFGTSKIETSPTLGPQAATARQALAAFADGTRPASAVFDVEKLARYFALCELYGSWHALAWHNVRFAWDPVAARLEPIGYDVNSNLETTTRDLATFRMPWVRDALADPILSRAFVREVDRMTQLSYLDDVEEQLDAQLQPIVLLLNREWPIGKRTLWNSLRARAAQVRAAFEIEQIVIGSAAPTADDALTLDLELRNPLRFPVEVVAVRVNDVRYDVAAGACTLPPRNADAPDAVVHLPVPGLADTSGPILVRARIAGFTEEQEVHVSRQWFGARAEGPDQPTTADALLQRFAFLVPSGDGIVCPSGDWEITQDFRIPAGTTVRVEPGTTLRFAEGTALIVDGELQLPGTAADPITLEPSAAIWSGVVVRSEADSVWSYVTVRGTGILEREGWMTTGGVTFYRCAVELNHCAFIGALGEDALNVFGARFDLNHCTFDDCASDAFDGDFVDGALTDCRFIDVAGDAVDVSGSRVIVLNCAMTRIGDKAISAGEQSQLAFESVTVHHARFGVVSKDRSQVEGVDLSVMDVEIGMAAYQKKPEYGPAQIMVTGWQPTRVGRDALAQLESGIRFGGVWAPTEDVDVDAMYAEDEAVANVTGSDRP